MNDTTDSESSARERDEYPNLFEKRCEENERLQLLRDALEGVREVQEKFGTLGSDKRQKERLSEANELLNDAIMDEIGSIAVDVAAKNTGNPYYDRGDESNVRELTEDEWNDET